MLGSALARFERTGSADESTQAGETSWDWLGRLERLLIHFFLIIFDSSADSSKLIMELMPTEATKQIEEIFRLLLQAEPEMYHNLGHIVSLAEKWLVHWGGDSNQKAKALNFVRLYLQGVKNKHYYDLPVEVRLQKLGSFISGLKALENHGEHADFNTASISGVSYAVKYVKVPNLQQIKRPPSPRVKPAAHFARVVANLLCDRPCTQPLSPPAVYADALAKDAFQNPLHGDQGFQSYVDNVYGGNYAKKDIFMKPLHIKTEEVKSIEPIPISSRIPVENTRCLQPIYTRSYMEKIKNENCCSENGVGDHGRSRHGKGNGNHKNDKLMLASSSNSQRIRPNRQKRRNRDEDGDEESVIVRMNAKAVRQRNRKSGTTSKSNRKVRDRDYGSDTIWEHDPKGSRLKRKTGKYAQVGDPDYNSDEEWVHKNGKRTRRKHPLTGGRRPKAGDPDYSSDEEWVHDAKGNRLKRNRPLRGGQRPQPGDLDYSSDEEWKHDKSGKRLMRRNYLASKNNITQPGDEDYNSDETWIHDTKGKRLKRKQPLQKGQRPQQGDPDYNSDEEWVHDLRGKRLKRKQPLRGGQRPLPGDLDYSSEEEWFHDKSGKRLKQKTAQIPKANYISQPGDPDYNSDETWIHDTKGKRLKRKQPLHKGQRPQRGDPDYNSDEEWVHDPRGKRLKRKQPLRGGQRPLKGDLDYNSDDEWEHDKAGRRKNRRVRPSLDSEKDTDEVLVRDKSGKYIKNKGRVQVIHEDKDPTDDSLGKNYKQNRRSRKSNKFEKDPPSGNKSEMAGRKSYGNQAQKNRGEPRKSGNARRRTRPDLDGLTPSGVSTQGSNNDEIKVKGVFRSQADLEEQMEKTKQKQQEEREALSKSRIPVMSVIAMRSSMLDHEKFVKKAAPVTAAEALKDLKVDSFGEDGFDEAALLTMLDNHRNKTVMTATLDTHPTDIQMSVFRKIGCPASMWGVLPIPMDVTLKHVNFPTDKNNNNHSAAPIQPNNVLREDTTGAFGDYAAIPGNVNRFKQIFRDEARALGLPRPSTAEITSKMITRTAKNVRKNLDEDELEDLLDPENKKHPKPKSEKAKSRRFVPKKRSVPLATVLLDLMKKDPVEFGSEESESGIIPEYQNHITREPPRDLHPGVMDEIAVRFHGVMSGPFIPHVDQTQRNRITFSLEDRQFGFYDRNPNLKGNGDGQQSYKLEDFQAEEQDELKLPSLAVREKTSSNSTPTVQPSPSPTKLPLIDDEDPAFTYTDRLLYPNDLEQDQNVETNNPRNSLRVRKSPAPLGNKRRLYYRSNTGSKNVLPQIQDLPEQGDQDLIGTMSPCWDVDSKLFKSPLRIPAIPLPDNLVMHIEKKCPGLKWPRGEPVAVKCYPSGQPFSVVFQNGAGRVHYPHGGLAVLISAPNPIYSRILIIRDPFDQFYFFDKAVLADLNCTGRGTVYDENGIIKAQYTLQGGYRQDGIDKPAQRWQWNRGGQRLILKLNRYMALKILDLNKIYLVFYGNKRGFRLNVGACQKVNLMSVTSDNVQSIPMKSERPMSACGGFDYIRGRFSTPVIGFVDKARKERCMTAAPSSSSHPMTYNKYSFSQCHLTDARDRCQNHDCYIENCRD